MSALPSQGAGSSPALRSLETIWKARAADGLSAQRAESMRRFLALGLPTIRDESWRYTNLRRISGREFVAPAAGTEATSAPALSAEVAVLLEGLAPAASFTLVDGRPVPWPSLDALRGALEAASLRDLLARHPAEIAPALRAPRDEDAARWSLLNAALFDDGLRLRVSSPLPAPILVLRVPGAAGAESIVHPRVLIEALPGASATVLELHVGTESAALANSVTRLELGRGARIEHYRVFAGADGAAFLDSLDVVQEESSECRQFTVALGGGLVRAHLDAHLAGRGARFEGHSLAAGSGTRQVDCVTVATHDAPDTTSTQTARAIASGTSRVVVNSKVTVRPGAVRAESRQSCRGMLLSQGAEIDARPQLEIYADEVKCAHGATTGRLDPDMLFYLLSRGLDRATAQSLLVFAFLADVLIGMSAGGTRAAIENALIGQLPDATTLRNFR